MGKIRGLVVVVFGSLCLAMPVSIGNEAGAAAAAPPLTHAEIAPAGDKESQANTAFWNENYGDASKLCLEILKARRCSINSPDPGNIRAIINLGICHAAARKVDQAESVLAPAFKWLKSRKDASAYDLADCACALAECKYRLGEPAKALPLYRLALETYEGKLGNWSPDDRAALEGVAGCLLRLRKNKEALPLVRRMAQIDYLELGFKNIRFGLDIRSLGDVYWRLGDEPRECAAARQVAWLFRRICADSLIASHLGPSAGAVTPAERAEWLKHINEVASPGQSEDSAKQSAYELIVDPAFAQVKGEAERRADDFADWRLTAGGHAKSAPGFFIMNPRLKQKGVIICLHGFSLQHTAFVEFARQIADYGYSAIATDMRGFGTNTDLKGFDEVAPDTWLPGLNVFCRAFKEEKPSMPIFLLGESMGGAIALQMASRYPGLFDGVMSAAPGGERYGAGKEVFSVAWQFLKSPFKPFDVGSRLINQASSNQEVKDKWSSAPGSRLLFSPEELLKFQLFMDRSIKSARNITQTPIIIFQGLSDTLVRPQGTVSLFRAIKTRDKEMLVIGRAEHLIFEERKCPQELVTGLTGWLDAHLPVRKADEAGGNQPL